MQIKKGTEKPVKSCSIVRVVVKARCPDFGAPDYALSYLSSLNVDSSCVMFLRLSELDRSHERADVEMETIGLSECIGHTQ